MRATCIVMVEAPWLRASPTVGQAGADHAEVVDAAVVVETRILDRQYGVAHHLRDLGDRDELSPFLAIFPQQHAIRRKNP